VLIFDRPIPNEGLKWQDLLSWWAETHGVDPAHRSTKRDLYVRLRSCLPDESPPQRKLFETYYGIFRETIDYCPALLPEVWLLYDPKTVKERGKKALLNQRMDFVLLLPRRVRIVIEVDGKGHYSNADGSASPTDYARMTRADRELKLRGYEVFRFGGSELLGEDAADLVRDFFVRLFTLHGIG
jgi:very-short-patch-repair endonuclease